MYLLADQASNAKLSKNSAVASNWNTSILYLSPADSSGTNICPASSPGCRAACLNTAGRGAMGSVQAGRMRKTRLFLDDRAEFMRQLVLDLTTIANRQERTGIKQAIRLNGTSDIDWENIWCTHGGVQWTNVMSAFPQLTFYDYTKLPARVRDARVGGDPDFPSNYYLTFSRSEVNNVVAKRLAVTGLINVAVVFQGEQLPDTWFGRPVIDGTEHDMRFLDKTGVIVGLLAKGKAKRDHTGFAIAV